MDALKSKGQMLDQINLEQIPRSGFDLSYSTKGTGKIGRIIPTRCMECLPSDSIKGSSQAALQFQPLAVPILANMRVKQETWYVPNHILLDNWDTFITKGQDLSDNSVLPSFSLQRYLSFVANYVFPDITLSIFKGTIVNADGSTLDNNAYYFISKEKVLYYLSACRSFFLYYRAFDSQIYTGYLPYKYQFDDFFDYRNDLIDEIVDYFDNYSDLYTVKNGSGDLYKDAIPLYSIMQYTKAGSPVFLPISFKYLLSSSDYIKDSSSYFDTYDRDISTFFNEDLSNIFVLSDAIKKLCQFVEDIFNPLVGAGCLFDYLGYTILSPCDFRYFFTFSFNEIFRAPLEKEDITIPFLFSHFNSLFSSVEQNVLPLRACYAIWYNNYRDKLLETAAPEPSTSSVITDDELFILSILRFRAWSKDSFNTALANTGTGNMVVPILNNMNDSDAKRIDVLNTGVSAHSKDIGLDIMEFQLKDGTKIELPTRYLPSLSGYDTNSENITQYSFSLDTLRRAGRTEKWIQKALIYGNLIQDALFTHWGVKIKNERIQLPEFVTSSVELVKIDTILNNTTISSADDSVQSTAGDKAGFASAYDNGTSFDWYSPENGYLISFMTVLPEQTYSYGAPRYLSKLRIFDYAFPEFAQIGMDAVYNNEVKNCGISMDYVLGIFGYQGRYYDYKCKQDEEHGQLRTTEDMYTFARDYNVYDENSRPKLNYRFVHCHPSLDMFVVDDPSQDQFRYDVHHSVAASRALPVCGMSV